MSSRPIETTGKSLSLLKLSPLRNEDNLLERKKTVSQGEPVQNSAADKAESRKEDISRKVSNSDERKPQSHSDVHSVGTEGSNEHSKSDTSDSSEGYSDGESESDYRPGGYHPVTVGDKYGKYEVEKKLGWGHFSTVWLVNHGDKTYSALKVQKSADHYTEAAWDEIELLSTVEKNSKGREKFVVHMLDHFSHQGPNGLHMCMVFELLGDNLLCLIKHYDYRGIPLNLVKQITYQICVALQYLHDECEIIHTDLKPENVLIAGVSGRVALDLVPNLPALQSCARVSGESAANMIDSKSLNLSLDETNEKSRFNTSSSKHEVHEFDAADSKLTKLINEYQKLMDDSSGSVKPDKVEERKKLKKKIKKLKHKRAKRRVKLLAEKENADYSLRADKANTKIAAPMDGGNPKNGWILVESKSRKRQWRKLRDIRTPNNDEEASETERMNGNSVDSGAFPVGPQNDETEFKQAKMEEAAQSKSEVKITPAIAVEENNPDNTVEGTAKVGLQAKRKDGKDAEITCKVVDLGNGCWRSKHFAEDIQTRQYRCPEVIIGSGYDTSADIWSLACMVFELATGDLLFDPRKGEHYERDDDHLALIMELVGEMPKSMALSGKYSRVFFNRKGKLLNIKRLKFWPLEDVLVDKYRFGSVDAKGLAEFLNPMLQLKPSKRATAAESMNHSWLASYVLEC
mmetsp:Transcript_17849/g.23358  ORF Transcript_17849/g.23358 Transcript_17849/m.23358 type:complete len:686 (-) Transcript_17849:567-2624(-)|eukprot:CAMPEP_0184009752 /NCGR_PEP_ID=MMETSP0954-20121128/2797_1 /TAXON_ID=627963 /ORGANISM="Aplanochytrium sp, Strain PBS07" /LENGTH=685 /DNA_ID=CAMNT_0026289195 /DNA_START=200 /DNA_END=2257 /DNA_ORIENTATION=-